MGFEIKLDTNGTNPKMVKHLVEEMLIDYIALDYKAPKEKFKEITKNKNFEYFEETLEYLKHADISFKVRTYLISDLLD